MIENQISIMTNPQEFTRLCNSIFTCIYGDAYQVIDGTRSDEGNDGYVRLERRILAIHCPIKPEKKTDKDYLKKIEDDMDKAVSLRDTDTFKIERWTFVTPRKLSNNVIAKMEQMGTSHGLVANQLEATYLANELYKNPHLLEAFPQLHILRIDAKLDEILEYVKKLEKEAIPPEGYPSGERFIKAESEDSHDNKRVRELRNAIPDDDIKKELKIIYYGTEDIIAQLNALMGLLGFFDPAVDSSSDMIELCDAGISLTESIDNQRFKALFLAWKAYLLSFAYIRKDVETFFSMMADNMLGMLFVNEQQRQTTVSQLRQLYEEYNATFNAALELTVKNDDPQMLAGVLMLIGNSSGQRSNAYRQMGVIDRAQLDKLLCKRSLIAAKNIYSSLNDKEGVVNAVFNLANQLRFLDEKDEALALAKQLIESAKLIKNKLLKQKINRLEDSIKTDSVPDYIHGERRPPYDNNY